jgi:predicted solute-binding protein
MRIAKAPFLNSAPFFRGFVPAAGDELIDVSPREAGELAASGRLDAGLLPLADFLRLEDRLSRVGHFGISVRGRAQSVLLFSLKPARQLEASAIAVTDQTSTSFLLLRLILEHRYQLPPPVYTRVQQAGIRSGKLRLALAEAMAGAGATAQEEAVGLESPDALLLIGDEALRFRQTNTLFPFETDLGFEWWLWQHLPSVFAVWTVRQDLPAAEQKRLETSISRSLASSIGQFGAIGQEHAQRLGMQAAEIEAYLSAFNYRFGQTEEQGIAAFQGLAHEHHLL